MHVVSQLWVLFLVHIASNRNEVKGNRIYNGGRVVGGERASNDIFPFIVSIQKEKEKTGKCNHICVGNILHPKWVLTACHCLARDERRPLKYKDPKHYWIVAGVTNCKNTKAQGRQDVRAKAFIAHPLCKRYGCPKYTYYDIGLIKLESPLEYNARVQPLKFFSRDAKTAVGELRRLQEENAPCTNPGWGRVQQVPTVERSSKLRVARQTLHTAKECHEMLCPKGTTKIPRGKCSDLDKLEQVCAVSNNASICRGDSGGPLVCNGFVFGVTSQGSGPCEFGGMQIFSGIETILGMVNEYVSE